MNASHLVRCFRPSCACKTHWVKTSNYLTDKNDYLNCYRKSKLNYLKELGELDKRNFKPLGQLMPPTL